MRLLFQLSILQMMYLASQGSSQSVKTTKTVFCKDEPKVISYDKTPPPCQEHIWYSRYDNDGAHQDWPFKDILSFLDDLNNQRVNGHYGDLQYCTTPLYDYKQDEIGLLEPVDSPTPYYQSKLVACEAREGRRNTNYSVRLFNQWHPKVHSNETKRDTRILCRAALDITSELMGTVAREQPNPDTPKSSSHFVDEEPMFLQNEKYEMLGESMWSQDKTWGVVVGKERNGCPEFGKEEWAILT